MKAARTVNLPPRTSVAAAARKRLERFPVSTASWLKPRPKGQGGGGRTGKPPAPRWSLGLSARSGLSRFE